MWEPSSRGFLVDNLIDFYRLQESDGLYTYWLKELLVSCLVFALFLVLSKILRYFLTVWGPRLTNKLSKTFDERILGRITPPLCLLVVFAGLFLAVKRLPFPERILTITSGAVFVVNVILLTNIIYRIVDEGLKLYALRVEERTGTGLTRQIIPLLEKLSSLFLICFALIITLRHFNYDVLSLVTALGIGSLALGMAAKDTLANMISGFTLMIDRPFRIGDRIQLSAGQWGDVMDIGLRSTKIKTVDNTLLIIPNSELCNTTIINMAFPDMRSKGRVNVGVAYGTDIDEVKRILMAVAGGIPEVLSDPQPEAFFVSYGESAINMALFFWVNDYTDVFAVTDRINTLVYNRFRENSIVIPYPTRTVMLEKER
jgi:MscS family membrane protein